MAQNTRQMPFCADDLVVIVDDESYSRFMAGELLDRLGKPRTVAAKNGDEALALLNGDEAGAIRLVLLDFNMPGRNGLEILRDIRSGRLAVASDVVVMMVTGVDTLGLVAAAMALDVDAFLQKPMAMADLRDHLAEIEDAKREIAPPEAYWEIDVDGLGAAPRPDEEGVAPEGINWVSVSDLAAGQEIAADICAPDGALLVSKGTAVTARLGRLLRGLAAAGLPVGLVPVMSV